MNFFKSFVGPFMPEEFYNSSINYIRNKIVEEYRGIQNLKKFGLVSSKSLNSLVAYNHILDDFKNCLIIIQYRKAEYVAKQEYINSIRVKYTIKPLPPLSTYSTPNPYQPLSISEADVPEPSIVECSECGAYKCADFIHECLPVEEIQPLKPRREAFLRGNFIKYKNNYYPCYNIKISKSIKPAERDSLLLNKIQKIISIFASLRKCEGPRLRDFVLFEQIQYDLIRHSKPSFQLVKHIYESIQIKNHELKYDEDFDEVGFDPLEQILTNLDTPFKTKMPEVETETIFTREDIVLCRLAKQEQVQAEAGDEEPHGDAGDLNVEQQSNVILTSHAAESAAIPITIPQDNWEKLCSSQNVQEYTQLMSRWQKFCDFKWTQDAKAGEFLKTNSGAETNWTMPLDFIKQNLDSPNCILFKQYAYVRTDMEIKILVNTNKFHAGALQASFYYGASTDKNFKDRQNIYCASQMTHCIIDAASASSGVLKIPYRYYKPLMATVPRTDDSVVLDIGNFRLFVLNSLMLPVSDNNTVSVSVYVRFVNPSFHGMKPRDFGSVQSEMVGMASLVKNAANLVNQLYPDEQRDNPSDVIPPKPMVPWNAHSWCLGDMTPEPINPLRLQATGNTPHPPGTIPEEPEMDIKYLTSIFGLINQVSWENSDAPGKILCKMPFSPILSEYPEVSISNSQQTTCQVLPPVSVISHLFAYWRGSLEYKLDFIATQFHTGRLIIAYIPRVISTNDPTLEQLTHCDNIIVDLRDERQILYTNSFLSDKPWWPRRSNTKSSTEIYPPGYIYIAVLNQLTATPSVSPKIQFNIYLRGASDFELHVPVNPRIGLSFNTDYDTSKTTLITYLDTYGPPDNNLYVGTWHSIGSSKLVCRYGSGSDHITQFASNLIINKEITELKIYEFENLNLTMKSGDNLRMKYFVLFTNDITYCYLAPFTNIKAAQKFRNSLLKGAVINGITSINLMTEGVDGYPVETASRVYFKIVDETVMEEYEVLSEMDDERKDSSGQNLNVQREVVTTNQGMYTFGEKITSIKQILRRYAPYCQIESSTNSPSNPQFADFVIPLMPQGLDLQLKGKTGKWLPYGMKVRDGPISILASGYRFFRGSMRMRFVVDAQTDGALWLNHRPDYKLTTTSVFIPDHKTVESVFQPGYATMLQFTSMNNVIEIEIPFYLPGQFGLLQRPNIKRSEDAVHYSLGCLVGGFDVIKGSVRDVPTIIECFYSMGDDMSFSVFQGFPPMFDLSIFEEVQAEGIGDSLKSKVGGFFLDSASQALKEKIDNPEKVNSLDISSPIEKGGLVDLIKTYISDLDAAKQQVILGVVSQLVHSLINPSAAQIAWSVASIFVHMGLVAISFLEKLVNSLKKFISCFNCLSTNKSMKSDKDSKVVGNAGESPETLTEAAFVSTCVAGMLALGGAVDKPLPKTLPNFASYLYTGLPKFTLSANGLYLFLKNNLLMFKKIWYWIVSKFNKDYVFYSELDGCTDEVRKFVSRVQWSIDSSNYDRIKTDVKASTQVYKLANMAQAYLAKRAVSTINKPMPIFEMYCKNIIKLRDELNREMLSPPVRFEPFVIAIEGASNVGKSHMAHSLASELLQSIGYTGYSELVYTRTPGNAYWNGLKNQPVCLFDDFLNIEDPQFAHVQIGELYCLKSKAVFNPPMAAIEEKKLRYNPLIVILCSNKAFPKISGVAVEEAWMRRRDVMYNVIKLEKYKSLHPRSLPRDIKKDYKHLAFSKYDDPSGNSRTISKAMLNYQELLPSIIEQFGEYFAEECEQYHKALDKVSKFYPNDDETASEFSCRVLDTLIESNDSRVQADERELITSCKSMLAEHTYASDMTKFAAKSILKIKEREMVAERESDTNFPFLKKYMMPEKYDNDILKEAGLIKGEMSDSEDLAISKSYNSILTEAVIHSAKSVHVPEILLGPQNVILNKDKLDAVMVEARLVNYFKYLEKKKLTRKEFACSCLNLMPFVTRYDYSTTTNPGTYKFEIPVKKIKVFVTKYDEYVYEVPDVGCCLDCPLAKKNADYHFAFLDYFNFKHIKELNKIYHPDPIKDLFQDYLKLSLQGAVPKGKVPLITKVLEPAVEKEIADKNWFEKLWSKVPKWGTIFCYIGKLTLIIAAIGVFLKSIKLLFNSKKEVMQTLGEDGEEEETDQYIEESIRRDVFDAPKELVEPNTSYSRGVVAVRNVAQLHPKAVAQASIQQEQVISNIIARNTFFIELEYGELGNRRTKLLKCLGLSSRYFILIDHYWLFIKSDLCPCPSLTYIKDGARIPISLETLDQVRKIKNSALYVCEFKEQQIPQFKNLIKFMIPASHTNNIAPQAKLVEIRINEKNQYLMENHVFGRIERRKELVVSNDDGSESYVSCTYTYPKCGKGLCGSVLVSSSNIPYPILGIHIAGLKNGSCGYSEAVVRETFAHFEFDDLLDVEANLPADVSMNREPKIFLDGNILQHGCVDMRNAIYPPPKTRLQHTECAGEINPITYVEPVLSSRDARLEKSFSPLLEGCKFHTNPIKPFPLDFVQKAVEDYRDLILSELRPQRMEVGKLTYEQAICGIPNNPAYEALPADTSEGYPWILKRPTGARNKEWMFDRELTQTGWKLNGMNQELFDFMELTDSARQKGVIQQPIYVDCLKDAKVLKEKALIPGKTRVFSVSSVDNSILTRQYTMDFTAAFVAAKFQVESAVGMDVNSLETNHLVHRMLAYGNNMVCGDYSKFGDQLSADLIIAFFGIIADWYEKFGCGYKWFRTVLRCFGEEVSHSTHLMINQVYQMFGGIPSGHPITIIINNACNSMMIRIIWQQVMLNVSLRIPSKDKKEREVNIDNSMLCFNENVRSVECGDDIWMSVKSCVVEHFNAVTISEAFAKFNIKFTNAAKGGVMKPYGSIHDVDTTFLKCTFVMHPKRDNVWMAKLDERAALEICNWTWTTQKDLRMSSVEACKAMMEEYFGHGPIKYGKLRRKVIDYWSGRGVKVTINDWSTIDFRIYDN